MWAILRRQPIFWAVSTMVWLTLTATGATTGADPDQPGSTLTDRLQAQQSIKHIYFAGRDNNYLIAENRTFAGPDSPADTGRLIVEALIKGPKTDLMRTMPPGTTVRAFYLTSDGTAYVDLSETVTNNHPGGCKLEILTVYSIVDSLILNIPEIESVKILIAGRETLTLAGHVDIRFPFRADMLLIR